MIRIDIPVFETSWNSLDPFELHPDFRLVLSSGALDRPRNRVISQTLHTLVSAIRRSHGRFIRNIAPRDPKCMPNPCKRTPGVSLDGVYPSPSHMYKRLNGSNASGRCAPWGRSDDRATGRLRNRWHRTLGPPADWAANGSFLCVPSEAKRLRKGRPCNSHSLRIGSLTPRQDDGLKHRNIRQVSMRFPRSGL